MEINKIIHNGYLQWKPVYFLFFNFRSLLQKTKAGHFLISIQKIKTPLKLIHFSDNFSSLYNHIDIFNALKGI